MGRVPWSWLGFLTRYVLVFALTLTLWPSVRFGYTRLVVAGDDVVLGLFESAPSTHVALRAIDQATLERGGLTVTPATPFVKLAIDTLIPFFPMAAAIPKLSWRNRLILVSIGWVLIYCIQVGLLVILFRNEMAKAYLDSGMDDVRHLVPFSYSPNDVKLYAKTLRPFWVGVGSYWTGPVVGLSLGAWLLSRQRPKK